jgi:hypothetical protein
MSRRGRPGGPRAWHLIVAGVASSMGGGFVLSAVGALHGGEPDTGHAHDCEYQHQQAGHPAKCATLSALPEVHIAA